MNSPETRRMIMGEDGVKGSREKGTRFSSAPRCAPRCAPAATRRRRRRPSSQPAARRPRAVFSFAFAAHSRGKSTRGSRAHRQTSRFHKCSSPDALVRCSAARSLLFWQRSSPRLFLAPSLRLRARPPSACCREKLSALAEKPSRPKKVASDSRLPQLSPRPRRRPSFRFFSRSPAPFRPSLSSPPKNRATSR